MHMPNNDEKKRIVLTENGEFKSIGEWLLETDGTALMKVCYIFDRDGVFTASCRYIKCHLSCRLTL